MKTAKTTAKRAVATKAGKQVQSASGKHANGTKASKAATAGYTYSSKEEVIRDYRLANQSRHASLLGRREVLTGKAKFGIFGDGKEVAQIALSHAFRKGDWRSGYYRDQTLMFALGISDIQQFFAQLYAHTDQAAEPASVGRQMNGHFGSRVLNDDGSWKNLVDMYISSADSSPTGSQMPRLVGLAYASRLFRELPELHDMTQFSTNGNEIAWGTIGNASCAEGMFWEAINAIGVLKSPAVISIWDDGYGISVPNEFQLAKKNLSDMLRGFQTGDDATEGFQLYTVCGWDYPALMETYAKAAEHTRRTHQPALVHVTEVTQPQGHSTSGSHERYKSPERLQWEIDYDCLAKMREWMLAEGIATAKQFATWDDEDRALVAGLKQKAWDAYITPIRTEIAEVTALIDNIAATSPQATELQQIKQELLSIREPFRRDTVVAVHRVLAAVYAENNPAARALVAWKEQIDNVQQARYSDNLVDNTERGALAVRENKPVYDNADSITGFQVLNACFDAALARDPRILIFGEDVGQLGDVNQGCAGLQEKYGVLRVSDTGIRECTIAGQAIGLAMRGLRPIAEIQYLDYLLYALQILSDDLATLRWRTRGGQKAPVIIRTRGHRLEGVWHSGSPMAGIINSVRGMHVLVPRDMTRAAGFYNTLLQGDDPAIVVEVLNGYRLREQLPTNIGEFTVPLGVPEVLREGTDITVVTYGASCRVALDAAAMLEKTGISVEIIDVQSLLPFDIHGAIVESLKKTNRILFFDEDVPGGATAFMMREVLEVQGGYAYLDSKPQTLTAKEHRPAYGTDGNYWSKPEAEHVFMAVYDIMHEANPARYPLFYR